MTPLSWRPLQVSGSAVFAVASYEAKPEQLSWRNFGRNIQCWGAMKMHVAQAFTVPYEAPIFFFHEGAQVDESLTLSAYASVDSPYVCFTMTTTPPQDAPAAAVPETASLFGAASIFGAAAPETASIFGAAAPGAAETPPASAAVPSDEQNVARQDRESQENLFEHVSFPVFLFDFYVNEETGMTFSRASIWLDTHTDPSRASSSSFSRVLCFPRRLLSQTSPRTFPS
jgi:hypothetical protein